MPHGMLDTSFHTGAMQIQGESVCQSGNLEEDQVTEEWNVI